MPTQCSPDTVLFAPVEGRSVVASFTGGAITSDAGALLLGARDRAINLVERFAACFSDSRDPERIEHALATLVAQRVFGIALGYEDLIDHDQIRHDPILAVISSKLASRRSDCAPLAGKSTLNRLEHAPSGEPSRYHRSGHDGQAIARLFVDLFLEAHERPPKQIILDLDATDDPIHGHQEGRFFHGSYDCHCYLPLYIFCGRHLLAAKLRRANIDASAGAEDEIARVVAQIRARWPRVRILLRARLRVRPRGADGLVRAQPGRLRVRAGSQPASCRGDRGRTDPGRSGGRAHEPAGAALQGLSLVDARVLVKPAAGDRQGGVHQGRS